MLPEPPGSIARGRWAARVAFFSWVKRNRPSLLATWLLLAKGLPIDFEGNKVS